MNYRLLSRLAIIALTATAGVSMAVPPAWHSPPMANCSDSADGTQTSPDHIWAPLGLRVTDVTLNGMPSDDCYGIVKGNLPKTSFDFFGTPYPLVAKSDDASKGAIIDGIDFSVTATGVKSGTWILTLADIDGTTHLPAVFDLVIGLKAGNNYAAYFFDDAWLDETSESGTFTIAFNNFQGNTNGLSHLSVYALPYEGSPGVTTFDLDPPQQVPEPESLALLVIGLAGMVAARGRRASTLRSMRG